MTNSNSNPEKLHEIANNKSTMTDGKWVNPGTPEAALVSAEQMPKAQVNGANNAKLKESLVK